MARKHDAHYIGGAMLRGTRKQYVRDAPYARALRWDAQADNAALVRMTLSAARDAWQYIEPPFPRRDAARLAHGYAQDAVAYMREDGDQLIRYPWRTVADGRGDCKSLSVLVAALCAASGCRVDLRFVQYAGEDWYGHVFAVVDGVPVDPELAFGQECTYVRAVDRPVR